MRRVFLIVMDSFGCGEAPDAAAFSDVGSNTLKSVASSPAYHAPMLESLGLGCIDGVDYLARPQKLIGTYGRLQEQSAGKDTTIGHWELAGIVSKKPLPVFPEGFPDTLMKAFTKATGYDYLCNKPYSGTEVIRDYGEEHLRTKKLIVYTSADSVFQIAAHEGIVPPEELYEICRKARAVLKGKYGVGRVIARPFVGKDALSFTRTANRRDFSLLPTGPTILDAVKAAGKSVIAVGKITDIFAAQGITESLFTHGNAEGMEATMKTIDQDFEGLCFVNLVDYDMLYGHRRDIPGYASAVSAFDAWLPEFMAKMTKDDVLLITADHGCDPGFLKSTDHTREYVPLLIYSPAYQSTNLGTRKSFSDVAASIGEWLGVPYQGKGSSFIGNLQ